MTISNVIRFGIPTLDELIDQQSGDNHKINAQGIQVSAGATASICILGPDGTGKSLLGMHLASRYAADCAKQGRVTKILYVSTDLRAAMAIRTWGKFALDHPNEREIPFRRLAPDLHQSPVKIELKAYQPFLESVQKRGRPRNLDIAFYLNNAPKLRHDSLEVAFIDLASSTAGDDWGFINRILAILETPKDNSARHLLIIDAVEGLETLVGERDAFGEVSSRRARIAQIMRISSRKCHVVFIVEEQIVGERLAEEFVADLVIRLRSLVVKGYARRTIEVEKMRGQSHIRGQHQFVIRSGAGSTTGKDQNCDDPRIVPSQSYIHIFHSLHRLNRQIMQERKGPRRSPPPGKYAAFGIRFLDDMLAGNAHDSRQTRKGFDSGGLPCSTVTALLGDPLTQKTQLGRAFLSRCYIDYADRLRRIFSELRNNGDTPRRALQETLKGCPANSTFKPVNLLQMLKSNSTWRVFVDGVARGPLADKLTDLHRIKSNRNFGAMEIGAHLLAVSKPRPSEGVAVLLTTLDVHSTKLSWDFEASISKTIALREIQEAGQLESFRAKLRNHIRENCVCRRLEIHDLSSPSLIHVVQQAVKRAQELVCRGQRVPAETDERFKKSWCIRLVIDDFSGIRDTYPETKEDPLFLPFLLFYLGREGATTLIIDTQSGRPDMFTTEQFASELRALVQNRIYTWRVPFYGENRVAIAAIPPLSRDIPAVVRELQWEISEGPTPKPPSVDPHFELYAGLEDGKPYPVPLQVRFYAETPAFEKYISLENVAFREHFTPLKKEGPGTASEVIVAEPSIGYDFLRDFSYLQKGTRLDHTLVFQIDEFWSIKLETPLQLRPQWDYLNACTTEFQSGRDAVVDPFALFQLTEDERRKKKKSTVTRRRDFFKPVGYRLDATETKARSNEPFDSPRSKRRSGKISIPVAQLIDRVPFMWDFGFLLCRERPWHDALEMQLTVEQQNNPGSKLTVKDVWNGLPEADTCDIPHTRKDARSASSRRGQNISWRAFLEASKIVARQESLKLSKQVIAFENDLNTPESLSCLVLEMWGSEILDSKRRSIPKGVNEPAERKWAPSGGLGLINLIEAHPLALFRTWLLLGEAFNFYEVNDANGHSDPKFRDADPSAVSVRHWYKTASARTEKLSASDLLVPKRLAGHFSVRGDWFLAVARGSRSSRLADLALDLLSSRRANLTRLQLGLGLPTRDIIAEVEQGDLRTKLLSRDKTGRPAPVSYRGLLQIGEKTEDEFYWLWRSTFGFYVRHSRIWHRWITRMLLEWDRLRSELGPREVDGFKIFDQAHDLDLVRKIPAWAVFEDLRRFLVSELRQATVP